jgi:hypothetical protein
LPKKTKNNDIDSVLAPLGKISVIFSRKKELPASHYAVQCEIAPQGQSLRAVALYE